MLASKGCRTICRHFLQRKYDLFLRPWIDDRRSFRMLLRHTNSVISGSAAVDFGLHGLSAPPFTPNDLDLYVGAAHALAVIQHLRFVEGYTAIPLSSSPPHLLLDDYHGGIATVVRMVRRHRPKIDVICSARISALHPLGFFWSTIPMTFLSADGFCTAYPQLFFKLLGCYNPARCTTERVRQCVQKYRARGFAVHTFLFNFVSIRTLAHMRIYASSSTFSCEFCS